MTAYRWRMAPGSYLVLSHVASDESDDQVLDEVTSIYKETAAPAAPRSAADIGEFFTGLDLIEPGLVDVTQWRSDMPEKPSKIRLLAGVGHKPRDLTETRHQPRGSAPCRRAAGGERAPGARHGSPRVLGARPSTGVRKPPNTYGGVTSPERAYTLA